MFSEPLNSFNAVWDDGEWISWDDINRYLVESGQVDVKDDDEHGDYYQETSDNPKRTTTEKLAALEEHISYAQDLINTGHPEKVDFGEMGELYAEIRYGIQRHRKCAEGSDGRIGNDFIEVKTITPWKGKPHVTVRRSGHFNKLAVVKIDEHFMFDARVIPKSKLAKGTGGKAARVSWNSMPRLTE